MARIDELAAAIAECTRAGDGTYETAVPDVYATRVSNTDNVGRHSVERAVFCVVARGAKSILLNGERYVYDARNYLVISVDLPLVGEVVAATPDEPFLGVSMVLDFATIGSLLLEIDGEPPPGEGRSLFVGRMDDELLDAVIRLARLTQRPADVAVLAPLVRKEILYKLLRSEHGGVLRRLTVDGANTQRIVAAIDFLRRNLTRTIRMDELAREVHMSSSTMHHWFKTVTNMSPLQYQKQLRLHEARRILLSETNDAADASRRVGYESPSQFSREYRRLFGLPPLQDMERMRTMPELVTLSA